MTTGELIRALSNYCPDTEIVVLDRDSGKDFDIHDLLDGDDPRVPDYVHSETVLLVQL